MDSWLTWFGEDRRIVGFASVASIVSLIYIVWRAGKAGTRLWPAARTVVGTSVRSRRRRRLLAKISEYKQVQREVKAGSSEFYMVAWEVRRAIIHFLNVILSFVMISFNMAYYAARQGESSVSYISSIILFGFVLRDYWNCARLLFRVTDKLNWKYAPQTSRRSLLDQAVRFRRSGKLKERFW
jgi:hypothetical protein